MLAWREELGKRRQHTPRFFRETIPSTISKRVVCLARTTPATRKRGELPVQCGEWSDRGTVGGRDNSRVRRKA